MAMAAIHFAIIFALVTLQCSSSPVGIRTLTTEGKLVKQDGDWKNGWTDLDRLAHAGVLSSEDVAPAMVQTGEAQQLRNLVCRSRLCSRLQSVLKQRRIFTALEAQLCTYV